LRSCEISPIASFFIGQLKECGRQNASPRCALDKGGGGIGVTHRGICHFVVAMQLPRVWKWAGSKGGTGSTFTDAIVDWNV
jgi:hypothetical protein